MSPSNIAPEDGNQSNQLEIRQPSVSFSPFSAPGLTAGKYTLTVKQTIYQDENDTQQLDSVTINQPFAVTSARFSFQTDEIEALYPPDLAKGNFSGAFTSVVFKRRALPWERSLNKDSPAPDLPWLAILLIDVEDDIQIPEVQVVPAKALVKKDLPIHRLDVNTGETGICPDTIISYPGIENFDYGETPDTPCAIIDINKYLFKAVAPAKEDMKYLAHVREINYGNSATYRDIVENYFRGETNPIDKKEDYSIIIGNRFPKTDPKKEIFTHAFLVSLENMGDLLKESHAAKSPLDSDKYKGKDKIRLLCYRSWRFVSSFEQDDLTSALKNLNRPTASGGAPHTITTLQFPAVTTLPDAASFETIVRKQESGKRAPDENAGQEDADILVANALMQGYVPLRHEMRHGNYSISWYRGPCSPQKLPYNPELYKMLGSADAANSYNPRTGLFDISYGAAWQLGQLLSLKNKTYIKALTQWKDEVRRQRADGDVKLEDLPEAPGALLNWFIQLFTLYGVPFNYLVPHEAMLPPESMRFFYLNRDWVDALLDGSFSLNRYHSDELLSDVVLIAKLKDYIDAFILEVRKNQPAGTFYYNDKNNFTGIIIRSQIVSSWSNLQIIGYTHASGKRETLQLLRLSRVLQDCLICLFDGEVDEVWIHEPPEQIYCQATVNQHEEEGTTREVYSIHLRDVPAKQCDHNAPATISFPPDTAINITLRNPEKRVIDFKKTVQDIERKLNNKIQLTSAEFAWQMLNNRIQVAFQVEKNNGQINE